MNWLTKQLGNLSIKMSLYVLLVVAVISGVSSFIQVRLTYDKSVESAHKIAESAMDVSVKAIETRMEKVEMLVQSSSRFMGNYLDKPDDCYDLLMNMLVSEEDVITVGLLFNENFFKSKGRHYAPTLYRQYESNTILSADEAENGFSFDYLDNEDENWLATLEGKSIWSEPYLDSILTGRPLVTYSVPVYDRDKNLVAALYAEMDLHWIWLLLNEVKPDPKSQITVIARDATFICHPDSSFVLNRNAVEVAEDLDDDTLLSITRRMLAGERGMDTLSQAMSGSDDNVGKFDKLGAFAYFAPVERCGRSLSFTYPRESVLAMPRALVAKMNSVSGIFILILMLLMVVGIYRIATPFAARLQEVTASNAVIENDLKIASSIQMDMIPKTFPAFPGRPELDVYGMLKPAKSVGGDLYDYFIKGNNFFFCIGDVSGKGMPASLYMAVTRSLFRNISNHADSPSKIASSLNRALVDGNTHNMFCTMFLGVLNLETGHLDYCNAGHNAPVLRRINPDGSVSCSFMNTEVNLALGVFDDFEFVSESLEMGKGEALFLYTDGVTEAESVGKSLFGEDKTLGVLADARAHHVRSAQGFIEYVYHALELHALGADQSDDITMLVVEYKGK